MTAANDAKLRSEILNLFQYIQRLREEIAGISSQQDDKSAFESMAVQLDEIVASTERATNSILEAIEVVEGKIDDLRGEEEPKKRAALCDNISASATKIMEACTFQDITGQRVSKIVGSLKFVEERVNAMAELWGRDEIEALGKQMVSEAEPDGDIVMAGPQLPGDAISQEDIDALFD